MVVFLYNLKQERNSEMTVDFILKPKTETPVLITRGSFEKYLSARNYMIENHINPNDEHEKEYHVAILGGMTLCLYGKNSTVLHGDIGTVCQDFHNEIDEICNKFDLELE